MRKGMAIFNEYKITLSSGDEIELDVIYQFKTYLCVLTGRPTQSQAQKLINNAKNHAIQKLSNCENPCLIDPFKEQGECRESFRLPSVTCCATFSSSSKNFATECDYLELHFVWFQESFALPISDFVLAEIRSINLPAVAVPCHF